MITRCNNIARLYEVCRKLDEAGFILISAFDNDGAFSYPAVFDCVIGVISGDKCKSIKNMRYIMIV